MEKPQGYDEAQAFGEFETLPAGGYKCIIKKVACEKTTAGKEFLKLAIDILEGEFKDFFQKKFDNDTREDRKWSGVWTVFTEGYNPGTTNPKFKGLITSVEASNSKFKFNFDEQTLVNKKVGIVFREEEFEGYDGQVHTSTKPFFAVSCDKAEEAKIPNPKKVTQKGEAFDDFTTASAADNDDLPF